MVDLVVLACVLRGDKYEYTSCIMSILCVLTPEIKPVKPRFSPAHKPGFTGLETGGFTRVFGYPGTRVAFPKAY